MREILFRGMAINGKWVYGNLSILKKDLHLCGGMVKAGCYISNVAGSPFAYSIRPETVGQYTGMEDERLNRIFEGDILDSEEFSNMVVSYNEHDACFIGGDTPFSEIDPDDDEIWKVIGNIHENPELLEVRE
jgi:hypothetical protein